MQQLAEYPGALGIEQDPTLAEPITIPTEDPDVELRQLTPGDADRVFAYAQAGGKGEFWKSVTKPYTSPEATLTEITESQGNEGNRKLRLGVWARGEFAGEVSLRPHKFNDDFVEMFGHGVDVIEYGISPDHRGQGLAALAARAASDYSLRVRGAGEVRAGVFPGNEASLKTLERLGFFATAQKNWYGVNPERLDAAQNQQPNKP